MAGHKARTFVQLCFSYKRLVESRFVVRAVTTKADLFTTQNNSDDIVLNNKGEALYAKLTSKELLNSLLNLQLVAYEPVVDLSIKTLTSDSILDSPLFRAAVLPVLKRTAYSHFCAGENVEDASRTLTRMWELGLRGIMTYGLEDAIDSESCDQNLEKFLQVVLQTSQLPPESVSSACVKISAICPIQILERVSSLLRWQHVHEDFNLSWKQDVIPVLAEGSPMYHVRYPPQPLTEEEEKQLLLAHTRLAKLCRTCESEGIPLLVDAEYTLVQPAIDYVINVAASEFNRGHQPLVYATLQTYLRDSFPRLIVAVQGSHHRGLSYGVKIVRGAYISRENALAASLGVPSPVHPNIEATHRCYDTCAAFMLEQAASEDGSVVLATHNLNSGRAAAAKVQELGLSRDNPRIQFAQLKGMADVLSLSLVHAGFRVSKVLPFGSVPEFIPFIVRRAQESRGLLGNTVIDRRCLRVELTRRLQKGFTL